MVENIVFEGINHADYPDYVDAYISSAEKDGIPLTEFELDELNEDSDFVHSKLMEHLY